MVGRNPLRIAFLAPTPPPVMGPSIATQVVFSEPPPQGIELHHIDTADRRSLHTLGRIDWSNVWNAAVNAWRLVKVIVAKRPQLVYIPISQTPIGYLRDTLYLVIAWLFRRKIALHLRGGNFTEFHDRCGRVLRWWIRWTLRRVDGVIVLGSCLRPMFLPFLPAEKIHVVPNGEDFPEFHGHRREFKERDGLHVAFLGNLIPLKGVGDLLKAAPAILEKHPRTRFTIAGAWRGTEFRDWAEKFVSDHGIGRAVRFAGPVGRREKTALLREADLFVLPSAREGHPWVIVEALAAGLPVVSCDAGCIRESVLDGSNGYLVPKNDPETLARAIDELLSRPELLQQMSLRSRQHYEQSFTRTTFRRGLFGALEQSALQK